jgi:hypothetical protein
MNVWNFESHRLDQTPRRSYFAGAAVVLAFLIFNVWVATDHYRNQNLVTRQTVDALEGVKQLAAQRTALLAIGPSSGVIDIGMMRAAGVKVPETFVRGDELVSPWGQSRITKQSNVLVWDFYEITTAGCTQLLQNSDAIAGVFAVASSSRAVDEKQPPLTPEVASQECRRTPLMARLVLK